MNLVNISKRKKDIPIEKEGEKLFSFAAMFIYVENLMETAKELLEL